MALEQYLGPMLTASKNGEALWRLAQIAAGVLTFAIGTSAPMWVGIPLFSASIFHFGFPQLITKMSKRSSVFRGIAGFAHHAAARATAPADVSRHRKLLAKGPGKCAEKFGEEAIEALIEAVKGDKDRLTSEAADVLFHLLVMLKSRDVALADVMAELDRRQGQSGLQEKASR